MIDSEILNSSEAKIANAKMFFILDRTQEPRLSKRTFLNLTVGTENHRQRKENVTLAFIENRARLNLRNHRTCQRSHVQSIYVVFTTPKPSKMYAEKTEGDSRAIFPTRRRCWKNKKWFTSHGSCEAALNLVGFKNLLYHSQRRFERHH